MERYEWPILPGVELVLSRCEDTVVAFYVFASARGHVVLVHGDESEERRADLGLAFTFGRS